MASKFKNYLKKLDIPDYAEKTKSTKELYRIYHGDKNNNAVDLELLDLSLGEQEKLTNNLLSQIKESMDSISKYTFTQDQELIKLISEYHKIPQNRVLITAGCDGALRVLSTLLIHSDTNVCIPLPSFYRFEYHARINKGAVVFQKNNVFPYRIDLDDLAAICDEKECDVVFLANPNNPTGIHIACAEIEAFMDTYKGYLILDEALVIDESQSCTKLLSKYPKLIITRSFSKLFGLAGLRVGYILVDRSLISLLSKLQSPFEVSSISINVAKAALSSPDYYHQAAKKTKDSLKIVKAYKNPSIEISPSSTSTFVIKSKLRTNLLYDLLRKKIKTVSCKDFRGLEKENAVRVSIRDTTSMKRLRDTLTTL